MARGKDYALQPGCLWPNTPSGSAIEIEVFGATGEYKSGKTLLGLSIAPGAHSAEHKFAGKPRTLLLDFEKSAGTYGGTGCLRIDVPAKMLEVHAGKNYSPLDVYNWFLGLVEKIEPGQFDVIMADPITDIESGMVDWVKKNHEKFGMSKAQMEKAGGLFWGAVKDNWKQVLLKLATRCKCFFFTSHLRDAWAVDRPVPGKREPKGKETLQELASLYLWMERLPDKEGNVAAVPAATVLKERLADTFFDAAGNLEIVQLMPPRLPEATVAAIRGYIANPPDYHKLKAGEKVIEKQASDEEKLRLQVAAAEADRDASANRLQLMARQAELRALQMQAAADKPPAASDQTAAIQKAKADKAKLNADGAEAARLKAEAEAKLAAAKQQEEKLLAGAPDEHRMDADPTRATRSQAMEIVDLCKSLGIDAVKLKEICRRGGAETVRGLKREVAAVLIEKLRAKQNGKQPVGAGAGN